VKENTVNRHKALTTTSHQQGTPRRSQNQHESNKQMAETWLIYPRLAPVRSSQVGDTAQTHTARLRDVIAKVSLLELRAHGGDCKGDIQIPVGACCTLYVSFVARQTSVWDCRPHVERCDVLIKNRFGRVKHKTWDGGAQKLGCTHLPRGCWNIDVDCCHVALR
jgi:hypothetical protein